MVTKGWENERVGAVTAKRYGISSDGDENVLKLKVVIDAHF